MIGGVRAQEAGVLGGIAVASLTGLLVALGARSVDAEFTNAMRTPPQLQAREVERVVRSAPDPLTGKGRGRSARCDRGGSAPLGNPWTCTVSYRSGRRVRIVVRVFEDGTYEGRYRGGGGVSGCCIDLPGSR